MKTKNLIIAIIFIVFASSCQKEYCCVAWDKNDTMKNMLVSVQGDKHFIKDMKKSNPNWIFDCKTK